MHLHQLRDECSLYPNTRLKLLIVGPLVTGITHTHTHTHTHGAATGQTLRCDVFVASIERIEITTRTRELLLGEEPEKFEVQAFDEEGW